MIEDIISLLVASKRISEDANKIRTCLEILSGAYWNDRTKFILRKSYLADDLESLVNLVLEPCEFFETLSAVDFEISDGWYTLNGLHFFQIGQLERYREATVFRFVTTIDTGVAITGSMYILGDKYAKLSEKYEAEERKLSSWDNSKSKGRYLGSELGVSANIQTFVFTEEMMRAWPDRLGD